MRSSPDLIEAEAVVEAMELSRRLKSGQDLEAVAVFTPLLPLTFTILSALGLAVLLSAGEQSVRSLEVAAALLAVFGVSLCLLIAKARRMTICLERHR